jgi:ATP-dependent Clp protease protease subunit
MEEIYAEHTGRSVDEIRRDMERDHFFTPHEARDYGLIDSVIQRHELTRTPTGFAVG